MDYHYFFALSGSEGELKRLHKCFASGIFNEPAVEFHVRVEHIAAVELTRQVQ